ncbi:hypothetical protein, partial [Enterobacter hormaechei]|uniref:hypothetical protein n=1 Tax=Enterobacter hormaechei TaxID=158836 RepID=UPI00197A91D5
MLWLFLTVAAAPLTVARNALQLGEGLCERAEQPLRPTGEERARSDGLRLLIGKSAALPADDPP